MKIVELPQLSVDLLGRLKKSESALASLPQSALMEIELRYRRFLFLLQKYPDVSFAPSKDIDEMWHLHMLNPRAYHEDCVRLFGDILDHDGGFGLAPDEEAALTYFFETTGRYWEREFGEPYVTAPSEQRMTKCTKACRVACRKACKVEDRAKFAA